MALLRALIGFSFTIFLIIFSVMNRQLVSVEVGPIMAAPEVPLYAVALGFLLLGFVFGGFFVWINGASTRKTKRKQRRVIKDLERELEHLRASEDAGKPPSDFFPAIPFKKRSV